MIDRRKPIFKIGEIEVYETLYINDNHIVCAPKSLHYLTKEIEQITTLKEENRKLRLALSCYANPITQEDNGRLAKEVLKALGREESE